MSVYVIYDTLKHLHYGCFKTIEEAEAYIFNASLDVVIIKLEVYEKKQI